MFLMGSVVLGGSYTRILVPEGIGTLTPGMDNAIPYFVDQIYPTFVSALFLVVIMPAMMSTVDGILLYVTSIFGNTMYKELYISSKCRKGAVIDDAKVEKNTLNIMKYSTILIGLVAAPIAFTRPANLTAMLWGAAGPIMSAVAGPLCVGIYSRKPSAKAAALGSVPGCASFVVLYFGKIIPSVYLCCGLGGILSVGLTALGTVIFAPMDSKHVDKVFANSDSEG